MASQRRRPRQRASGYKSKNRLVVIAVEGKKTEMDYFSLFKISGISIDIEIVNPRSKSHPSHVLNRLQQYLQQEDIKLRKKDAAWLVVDRDCGDRTEQQLNEVFKSCNNEKISFSLSNPCFEYWLLLHFEDAPADKTVGSAKACRDRLLKHLPHYEKGHVEVAKLKPGIAKAIRRAKQKDTPPCSDWPKQTGTTVYRLVESITTMS